MSAGVLNAAMLVGLLGAALPVVIHLFNRRREPLIDWGAIQFLDLGRESRRRVRLAELLLLLARMALLALVALALARPFWRPGATADSRVVGGGLGADAPTRDVVLVIDGSASMEHRAGGTTPRALALRWARRFVARLRPGDSLAVLVAGDRVRPLIDPPRFGFDRAPIDDALSRVKPSRGSSDLLAALAEAFRVLERTGNPVRDVVVLTDGRRSAWRPDESRRWALLRDLQRRLPVPPRVWSLAMGAGIPPDGPNGAVGPIAIARPLVAPGQPIAVTTTLTNDGPGPLTVAAELVVDGRPVPGSATAVGPIPAGGRAPLTFRTAIDAPGGHAVAVRLVGDDALPVDNESAAPVQVTAALPVLLVEGRPGAAPLRGATDFVRAALSPTGDDTPIVRATVIPAEALDAGALQGQAVAVLADVDRLSPAQSAAIGRFLDAGGGLLVAPGDRTNADALNGHDWLPARLGPLRGDPDARRAVAHPAPSSVAGRLLSRSAHGDAPPLAEADLFAYRVLTPAPGATVAARLDNGDPWAVERPRGRGRVLLLAASLDAESGTLPVNPDFVPLVHEWAFDLAAGNAAPRVVRPGEPLIFDLDLDPATAPPPAVATLPVQAPDGATVRATVVRESGAARARARLDANDTTAPGLYRLARPDPPGGFAYAMVAGAEADRDRERESDPTPLATAEAARLAEGWPLAFDTDPSRLESRLLAAERRGRRELWRGLILAALAGLCLEVYLTRRLVRRQGPAGA